MFVSMQLKQWKKKEEKGRAEEKEEGQITFIVGSEEVYGVGTSTCRALGPSESCEPPTFSGVTPTPIRGSCLLCADPVARLPIHHG
jgi:hypothetical protein